MAARKKKSARKAVKKAPRRKAAATSKKAKKKNTRHQPENLRIRLLSVGYTVNDIDRSVAWYRDVLGMVVADKWMEGGKMLGASMQSGTASIWLGQDDWKMGRDRVKGTGVRIYCKTAQDIDKLANGIKARGGKLDHDPETQPWGVRDFGITDPDGYRITVSTL